MSDTYSRDNFEYLSDDEQDFTLESILAEFKGSAYIAGDKKSSPDLLDERVRRIVQESVDGGIAENELYTFSEDDGNDFFAGIYDPAEEISEEEPIELTEDDKKYAARTADIDWEPVKGATSLEEVRSEAAAFFAKRDEAVERREEEILREKQEAHRRAEEERIRREEEERLRREEEERMRLEEEERIRREEAAKREEETNLLDFRSFTEEDDQDIDSEFEAMEFSSEAVAFEEPEFSEKSESETDENIEESDSEILFFDNYRFADHENGENYAAFNDYSSFEPDDDETEKRPGIFARIFGRKAYSEYDDAEQESYDSSEAVQEPEPEFEPEPEVYIEEPDFAQEASKLVHKRNSLMIKSRIALLIAIIMGIFTILFDKGKSIPFIGDNSSAFFMTMVIMQLVVIALSIEVLARGITSLFRREIGAEALVLFSNLVTYIAACVAISGGTDDIKAPFCAVSAFAAAFSLWGEYRQIAAMSLALKTAASSASPQILSGQYVKDINASLVRKYYNSPEGFYNRLVDSDAAEQTYNVFAPFLIIAAVLLSAVSSIGGKVSFLYCLSAVAAAAGSFTALSAFAVPFSRISKKLRRSGSAVAGWGGADDIYFADGVRLTDSDIFPGGAQVSGPTALESVKPEKILRYSASLMIASNSGLSKGFENLMEKQGLAMVGVENFECYEGGYAAVIRGERVVCGSAACMALLGLRIPQSVNSKNAVFTAINDAVVGTFTVTYKPSRNVQMSLLSLIKSKVKLYFAVRDFNITPLMVQQKLQIPVDEIEYLPSTEAYRLTADPADSVPCASAVIARNMPGIYAETVKAAIGLRTVTLINTALSVITTIIGMLVVFLLSWKGDGSFISPSNLMEYMLAAQVAIILLSNATGIF